MTKIFQCCTLCGVQGELRAVLWGSMLSDLIRVARVGKRLGLRELAKAAGIAPSYLSDIENDRRIPSEDVLRKLAEVLALDFDELMAQAGKFGERADRYLRRHPTAGTLFRRLSERNLSDEALEKLLKEADRLSKKKE